MSEWDFERRLLDCEQKTRTGAFKDEPTTSGCILEAIGALMVTMLVLVAIFFFLTTLFRLHDLDHKTIWQVFLEHK